MLKITALITATVLLSSCSSTIDELYQDVSPNSSSVVVEEGSWGSQENIANNSSSSFESQQYAGNYARQNNLSDALKTTLNKLKTTGVKFVLHFSYDDSEIDESATQEIIKHANFMRNNPSLNLRLEGHADERGTREYNLALGENRALSVKEVLSLYELDSRVEVISFGEENPQLQAHDENAWQQNRRVEFIYQ